MTGNPKVKSQGQIFQECQGQIPMSNRKMRQNHHLENTGFNRRKVETTKWKIPRSNGENRKKPVLTEKKWENVQKPPPEKFPRSNISGMSGNSGMCGMCGMKAKKWETGNR